MQSQKTNILELLQKGIPFKTRNGFKAKFVCLLSGDLPYPVVINILYDEKDKRWWNGRSDEWMMVRKNVGLNNYSVDGRLNITHETEWDLQADQL